MTGHQINSLVGDLVAMAQAMERLPHVEAELDKANTTIEDQAKTIQRLEIKLIDAKAEADALHSTIRTLEASRDDAEFRFLEAEDRTASALAFVRTVFGNAGALIQALDPPKATESVKVEYEVSVPVDPTPVTEPMTSVSESNVSHSDVGSIEPMQPQGQSDPDPTVSSQDGSTHSSPIAPSPIAEPMPDAPTPPTPDPYSWGHDAA